MNITSSFRLQLFTQTTIFCLVTIFHTPSAYPESINFSRLPIETPYRLEKSFKPDPYFGVIQSRKQLEILWSHLVHAEDEGFITLHGSPEMPEMDFSRYALFWFADQGAQASYTDLKSLNSHADGWTATVEVVHSDFGSRRLNLWRIPIPDGPVAIQEKHLYDRGP